MIKIAKMKQEFEEIEEFAFKNGFETPYSKILLYDSELNDITGVMGIDNVMVFEPLISNSLFVSNNLFHAAMGIALINQANRVECYTTDERMKDVNRTFEKLGFNFLEKTNRFVKIIT